MYKPGQLITKSIRGTNHVLRIAECDPSWEYPCGECIIDAIDSYSPIEHKEICEWCIKNLNNKMYLKKA